ncbi:MAG: replication initiator protein A [Oscillospiraceae bacterium]|nr:replication initiator protein A [Oscillospiraceae bacterium]
MTDYMTADTALPPYFPYPQFLMDMSLSHTAALTYTLLLDRAHLSQLNGWMDEAGRVYIVFPVEKIAAALNRSLSSAKNALAELSAAGLIERRRRGQFLPNLIYVKLPEGQKIVLPEMDNGLSISGAENDLRNS